VAVLGYPHQKSGDKTSVARVPGSCAQRSHQTAAPAAPTSHCCTPAAAIATPLAASAARLTYAIEEEVPRHRSIRRAQKARLRLRGNSEPPRSASRAAQGQASAHLRSAAPQGLIAGRALGRPAARALPRRPDVAPTSRARTVRHDGQVPIPPCAGERAPASDAGCSAA
jgi:hypothetical protein